AWTPRSPPRDEGAQRRGDAAGRGGEPARRPRHERGRLGRDPYPRQPRPDRRSSTRSTRSTLRQPALGVGSVALAPLLGVEAELLELVAVRAVLVLRVRRHVAPHALLGR